MRARIAFFSWSVFGPCLSAIQSVVSSSIARRIPACAAAEYGVALRTSSIPPVFGTMESLPQSLRGNR
jgi:hypothetical protein